MRRCPYCLRPINVPRKRYCCPEHARRAANERQRAAAKLKRVQARAMKRGQAESLLDSRWRDAAAGRKPLETLLAEVWGVSEVPPMFDPSL